VIKKVENRNADTPVNTDPDRSVSKTFTPTLPHNIVAKRKFESSRSLAIGTARGLFFEISSSNLSLGMLKKARFSPENMADCEIEITIPIQIKISIAITFELINKQQT